MQAFQVEIGDAILHNEERKPVVDIDWIDKTSDPDAEEFGWYVLFTLSDGSQVQVMEYDDVPD